MNPESSADGHGLAVIRELQWLQRIIQFRSAKQGNVPYYENDPVTGKFHSPKYEHFTDLVPPELEPGSNLHDVLLSHRMTTPEARLLLALPLAVCIDPAVFNPFYSIQQPNRIPALVSLSNPDSSGFFKPGGLTWIWLIAGNDRPEYLRLIRLLESNTFGLLENEQLCFENWHITDPPFSTRLYLKQELFYKILNIQH